MDGIFDPLDRVKWEATIFDLVLENDLIWRVMDDSIVNGYILWMYGRREEKMREYDGIYTFSFNLVGDWVMLSPEVQEYSSSDAP